LFIDALQFLVAYGSGGLKSIGPAKNRQQPQTINYKPQTTNV
jgi:hypothetical protein